MQFKVITLFPEVFPGALGISVLGRAKNAGLWSLEVIDLRKFAGKSCRVDDSPYGGGPGMVIRPDVLGSAIDLALAENWKDAKVFF